MKSLSHKQSTCIVFTVECGRVHSFLEKQGGSGVTAHQASAIFILPLGVTMARAGHPHLTFEAQPSGRLLQVSFLLSILSGMSAACLCHCCGT